MKFCREALFVALVLPFSSLHQGNKSPKFLEFHDFLMISSASDFFYVSLEFFWYLNCSHINMMGFSLTHDPTPKLVVRCTVQIL